MTPIPDNVIKYINATPELQSFLYDLNLLPESCNNEFKVAQLRGAIGMYVIMKAKTHDN